MKQVESLECRRHFAADPFFTLTSKGTLIVQGTDANESIGVSYLANRSANKIQVEIVENSALVKVRITHEVQVDFKWVKRITVDGGDGNDDISIEGPQITQSASLLGGAGNDSIVWDSTGPVFADGGDGNDNVVHPAQIRSPQKKNRDTLNRLFGNSNQLAPCTLLGEGGDDNLQGDINDHLNGGGGKDLAHVAIFADGSFSQDQANALAADYYARLGATNIEKLVGDVVSL